MNRLYKQTMLFDFYGELLTEHQRRIYEDAVYNDLSLSEIAEEQGISRQGVHDLIRRCDRILQDYEERLHLVEKFTRTRNMAEEIRRLAGREAATRPVDGQDAGRKAETFEAGTAEERLGRIRSLAEELLQEL